MKILRMFDSLKFVRAMFVAVAIFAFAPTYAATLPAGYTELEYLESTGTQYIDTGVNIGENIQTKVKFGKTTNSFSRFGFVIGGGGHYQGLVTRMGTNSYYSSMYSSSQNTIVMSIPDNVFEITFNTQGHKVILNNTASYDLVLLSPYEISNTIGIFRTPGSSSTNNNGIGKVYSFVITDNLTNYILFNGIPVRRDSDGVLGMYDLADANPATAFHTNAGTGEFVAGPAVPIKIATTKYNEESFAPVKTDLSAAMNAVDDVVSRTMSQAQAIDQIATTKQTRPDEGCDAKYCLLVEDEDGTPHWYPIAGANGVAHNLPVGYTELQYTYMTSGSYLLTDIVPTYDGKVVFEFTTTTPPVSGAYFLGGRTATYGGLFFGKSSGGVFIVDAFGSAPNNRYTSSVIPADNTRYKFTFDNKVATLESGGSTLFTETFTGANANGANLAINTLNNNGTTMGYSDGIYVHSLKVWNAQGELVANYIPAKQTNPLTVGFYDTVSKTFKTATAGTFTAGPDM